MTELLEPINFGEYEVKKIFAAAAAYTLEEIEAMA